MIGAGQNGQWVRTRNPEGARAFVQERALEAERRAATVARSRARRARAMRWLRSGWARIRSR